MLVCCARVPLFAAKTNKKAQASARKPAGLFRFTVKSSFCQTKRKVRLPQIICQFWRSLCPTEESPRIHSLLDRHFPFLHSRVIFFVVSGFPCPSAKEYSSAVCAATPKRAIL